MADSRPPDGGALFPLGRTVITRNAQSSLDPEDVVTAMARHAAGDWGELDEPDRKANAEALRDDLRLFSRYSDCHGNAFYIITEHDRSVTTVLLPEDY